MLIDSHCHLADARYGKSVSEILAEAKKWDVTKCITIGTSIEESKNASNIAGEFSEVYATAGIYPHEELGEKIEKLKISLEGLLDENVVAVGECGIDVSNWEKGRPINEQIELFEMQIELAIKHNLPLCIHNRNGDEQILNSLKKYPRSKGVIHCFASTWEFACKMLDAGFYISFSAIITYPPAKSLLETVKKVPLDRFLVETDAPYLPPQGHRGEVNTPRNVKIVAQRVAEIKDIPFKEVCKHSYDNTCSILSL